MVPELRVCLPWLELGHEKGIIFGPLPLGISWPALPGGIPEKTTLNKGARRSNGPAERRFHSELAISGGSRDDGHPKGILGTVLTLR
jgi:hypothetical protein